MLDRDFFINKHKDLTPKKTSVEGVGECWIRKMSLSEFTTKVEMWMRPGGKLNRKRQLNFNLRIVQLCVTDENGRSLFTEDEFDVVADNTPVEVVSRLANYCCGAAEQFGDDLGE